MKFFLFCYFFANKCMSQLAVTIQLRCVVVVIVFTVAALVMVGIIVGNRNLDIFVKIRLNSLLIFVVDALFT